MTAAVRTTTATVHSAVHRTDCHGSVNLCLSKQHGRPRQREENRIYLYAALNLKRNNRRLRSTYCTIEANYWQTRSISRGLSATSRLLFKQLRLSVVVKINGIVTTTQREQIQWADRTQHERLRRRRFLAAATAVIVETDAEITSSSAILSKWRH